MFRRLERLGGVTDDHDRPWATLTLTELAAAKFVRDGLDVEGVADRLGLSPTATEIVIDGVFDKLGVLSRVELVIQSVARDCDLALRPRQ